MELKRGWYKHYKGKYYFVEKVRHYIEALEYQKLVEFYDEEHNKLLQSYDDFFKLVEINGKKVQRFEYIGEKLFEESIV